MTFEEVYKKLAEPFRADEIEWRVQRSGKSRRGSFYAMVLAYVDSRAIRKRLNQVVGPGNWSTKHYAVGDRVACALSIRAAPEEGSPLEWITKTDGAGDTQVEGAKGSFSDSIKRAGYSWGIGEYLYDLEANWAKIHEDGRFKSEIKYKDSNNREAREWVRWDPPELPDWALPQGEAVERKQETAKTEAPQDEDGLYPEPVRNRANLIYQKLKQAYEADLITSSERNNIWMKVVAAMKDYNQLLTEEETVDALIAERQEGEDA